MYSYIYIYRHKYLLVDLRNGRNELAERCNACEASASIGLALGLSLGQAQRCRACEVSVDARQAEPSKQPSLGGLHRCEQAGLPSPAT